MAWFQGIIILRMSKRAMVIFGVLTLVLAVIFAFIRIPWMNGLLLGSAVSALLMFRNVMFWSDVLDSRFAGKGTGSAHFLVNYLLMVVVMLLSVKYPQYLNIYTCALGLLMTKISLLINELLKGGSAE